jgi:hypothetical protein
MNSLEAAEHAAKHIVQLARRRRDEDRVEDTSWRCDLLDLLMPTALASLNSCGQFGCRCCIGATVSRTLFEITGAVVPRMSKSADHIRFRVGRPFRRRYFFETFGTS